MGNKNVLRGWDVNRGKTTVVMKDGTKGIIMEWYGGYFTLDNGYNGHRSDIVEWHN